jgi:putative transposase
LTDKKGIPLSVVITAANTHDMKAATETLDGIILVKRSSPRKWKQNLCLDKGYDFPEIQNEITNRGHIPHIRHKGEKNRKRKRHKARRWVVERTNSWHNRFRKLLIRYEKKAENYLGLVHLACCIIIYRRIILG